METYAAGHRIHYQLEGRGPPLVLVPGLLGNIGQWHDYGYVEALKDHFQLLIMDPLGHGASDKPSDPAAYRRDAVAAEIVAVMDAAGWATAHVWGYSRGGAMTANVATAYPHRMRTIIVGGAGLGSVLPEVARTVALERAERDKIRVSALRDRDWTRFWGVDALNVAQEKMARENDPEAIAAAIEGWANSGPAKYDFSGLNGRILNYAGSNDLGLSAPGARENYAAICNGIGAQLEILEGLNHFQGFERQDLVLPIVIDFMTRIEGAAP